MKTLISNAPLSDLFEKLIHPALIKKALFSLPFNEIEKGSLTLSVADEHHRFEGQTSGTHAELHIKKPMRAYWLIKTQGELGFALAYYEGAVDSSNLHQLMLFASENASLFESLLSPKTFNLWHLWQHRQRRNSEKNSRKNISFHYDLGNDFYRRWLDESMTYSSGYFKRETDSLAQAQDQKYERILEMLDPKPGSSILEVGCGWGGFMEKALQQGCRIKGLTLSKEQQAYAINRLQQLGFGTDFEVALQDYRHEKEAYDHIVSIEMFEAVGKEYWQSYFQMIKSSLKPGGKAVIQVITIDDDHAESYQKGVDFIQAYIFPGGLLPSVSQFKEAASQFGLEVADLFEFGQDYARTCEAWKHNFNQQAESLKVLGFDEAFQRLWNYYLDYCIVGFETRHISVHQFTLQHEQ